MAQNDSLAQIQDLQTVQRLSPQQVQYVRILEMSAPEVEEEVRRQLDDNPALEVADTDDNPDATDTDVAAADERADWDDDIAADDDPADYPQARSETSAVAPQYADDGPDLYDWLKQQLAEMDLDPTVRSIAVYIIGNIDANGYLTRSLRNMADDIAIATGFEVDDATMQAAYDAVRRLDPPGIGAMDLRDCLMLQLQRMQPTTLELRIARDIVDHYFDLFSKMHYDRLKAQIGIDDDQLRDAIQLIQRLNPKPGSVAGGDTSLRNASHIWPDVAVEVTDDGRFSVWPVTSIPQLQIETSFAVDTQPAAVRGRTAEREREAQQFIRMKRNEAETFINALRMRGQTLTAVAQAIVKIQRDFFLTGEKNRLRPMILKDISEITGLDQSVISRATNNKYIATARGTYPLKMFFNEAPKENSDTSTHQIQHKLREVIDNEDKRHPLSDEAIREAMTAAGYDVARRTVTKYREKMGIPVARLRKKI